MKKISLVCLMVLSFAACTKKNTHPDYFGTIVPQHPADELWTNAGSEPNHVDPNKISDSVSWNLSNGMFVRLTEIHPITQLPVGDFATHWDVSEDGYEYTFYLRKNAKWSDGKPLTARDVEYSWKRLLNPATGSEYAQLADIIDNGREYRTGSIMVSGLAQVDEKAQANVTKKIASSIPKAELTVDTDTKKVFIFIEEKDFDQKQILQNQLMNKINEGLLGPKVTAEITPSSAVHCKALDDHTFKVKLSSPAPYFPGMISYIVFAPLPEHLIEDMKKKGKEDMWVRAENIVVSGPFKVVEEEFKQYKIFRKNPLYYDAKHVRLNKVKAIMIESGQGSMNAYRTGQHDWSSTESYPSEFAEQMEKYKDNNLEDYATVYYYQFNTRRKPLDDKNIRLALSLAVDRQAIVDSILKQGQTPARDLLMEGLGGYKSIRSEIFNPEKAKKLLADAGYPNGEGFPKFVIKFNTLEGHRKIATAVQEMWKKNLNIHVDIANMEWRSLQEDQRVKNFDLMRMAWTADYLDPHTFLSVFLSESANNHTGWGSKAYDELVKASDFEKDTSKRLALFEKAEQIIAEEQPIMPMYWYTRSTLVKPYLKGFWPNLQSHHHWKYMWIDDRWYDGVPENPEGVENKPWK